MRLPQSLFLLAVAGSSARASNDKVARPRGVGPECECRFDIPTPGRGVHTAPVDHHQDYTLIFGCRSVSQILIDAIY